MRKRKKVNLTVDAKVEEHTRKHAGQRGLSRLTEQLWREHNTVMDTKPKKKGKA